MDMEELNELKKNFDTTETILEALSSKVRRDIILELAKVYPKGLRICEIKQKKCITRPTMSFHMKLLCKAELIKFYKDGTKNYYYLAIHPERLTEIENLFSKLHSFMGDAYASSN
ncbi:MAG: winged helix-turn-helix domain-containing protein [Anaeroplasmataceae bacterium]|nr:winged helix-turn-helix domain-containing protein [Anaeroplasmataceae bacterium]MDE6414279.1 winged helix-turn-helix domain-containing protein [Anaeroplasmataceae bacterium]